MRAVYVARAAVYKLIFLGKQRLFVLFTHCTAHEVGLAERKTRKVLEYLHYLFLVDGYAVGDL